jgi:uncharacterized membrane protein
VVALAREGERISKLAEPVEIAKLWKSPRNKRHTLHFAFKEYEGHAYLDVRTYVLNAKGQAVPTKAGVTVSPSRLEEFAAAATKALAKAKELGLLDDESEAGE